MLNWSYKCSDSNIHRRAVSDYDANFISWSRKFCCWASTSYGALLVASGLYFLFFHNCEHVDVKKTELSFWFSNFSIFHLTQYTHDALTYSSVLHLCLFGKLSQASTGKREFFSGLEKLFIKEDTNVKRCFCLTW